MRKRNKVLLALLCLPALVLFLLLFPGGAADMPSYKGRSVSDWAEQLASNPKPNKERQEAITAIRALAPGNITMLVGWLGYDYEARYATVLRKFRRLPPIVRDALIGATMNGVLKDHQQQRAEIAEEVLPIILPALGSQATPAFVQLSKLINSTNAAISDGALRLVSHLGTNGLAILLPIVADENHPRRIAALLALDRMPFIVRYANNAVPVLLQCTNSRDPRIATLSARSLDLFQHAPISVPILIELLSDPDPQVRAWAIRTLGGFGLARPRAREGAERARREAAQRAVPFLIKALQDPILAPREEATNALLKLAPEALTNAPSR